MDSINHFVNVCIPRALPKVQLRKVVASKNRVDKEALRFLLQTEPRWYSGARSKVPFLIFFTAVIAAKVFL